MAVAIALLWLLLAAAIASCLVVLVGNVRVIEAIDGDDLD